MKRKTSGDKPPATATPYRLVLRPLLAMSATHVWTLWDGDREVLRDLKGSRSDAEQSAHTECDRLFPGADFTITYIEAK